MASSEEKLGQVLSMLQRMESDISFLKTKVGAEGDSAEADAGDGSTPPRVAKFDEQVLSKFSGVEKAAQEIGVEGVNELTRIIQHVFQEQRKFLELSAKCKKPGSSEMPKLMKGLQDANKKANDLKYQHKGKDLEHHANAVADGILVAQWVMTESMPHQVVESYQDGAVFSLNRIRKNYKGQAPHMDWCKAFEALLKNLHAFVKENFKTGLTWNAKGANATEVEPSQASSSGAGSSGASRAPPAQSQSSGSSAPTVHNVFEELKKIDQSSGKTAGLKHVTKDMKTKNQAEKSAKVSGESKVKPAASKKAETVKPKKPPRTELISKRWFVENHVDLEEPLHMDKLEMMQEVYISDCENATIILNGKCKTMQINKCKKCKILCDRLISSCELVDCQRCQIQVQKVPSLSIDKTDGLVVFLPYQTRDTQIVTSKCSEINVSFPESESEDANWIELPIPEQYQSTITKDNQITTTVSDLYS